MTLGQQSASSGGLAGAARERRPWEAAAPLFIAAFAYALMVAAAQSLLHDGDTYFHIAAGNWIWAHGRVPGTDPFSFTMQGMPWIAHEWLAEVIFAGVYRMLGWSGVIALTAAAIATTYYLLARFLKRDLPGLALLVAITASFLLLAPHLLARPHVLTMPLLVAWVAALERARAGATTPSLLVLPVMVLWANLHGGFVVGLGLIGVYAIEALLEARDGASRWRSLRAWGFFAVAAGVASLLTPFGLKGPLFAFHLMRETYSLGLVSEWHSTDFSRFQPLEVWILGLVALGFALRPRLGWVKMLLLLGLVHLALAHARNADLLAVIGPMILAAPMGKALGGATAAGDVAPLGKAPYGIAAAAIALATSVLWLHPIVPSDARVAPAKAVTAAVEQGITGPVFNAYDFGGYLIFAGIHPFVDGRIDLYGDRFMESYAQAVAARDGALPRLLDRYHIAWTLLSPRMPAAYALDHMAGWRRVYADANAVIFRRVPVARGRHRPPS